MKDLIISRLESYKMHRQEWIDKQNNYKWTSHELENGSTLYGSYQEKEALFTTKIVELEWVLSIII